MVVLSWHGLKREAHGLGQCKLPLGRSWDVGTAASDPQNVGRRTRVVTHGMVEGPNHGMVEGQIIEWWKDMKDEQHWFLLSQSDVELGTFARELRSCSADAMLGVPTIHESPEDLVFCLNSSYGPLGVSFSRVPLSVRF